MSHSARHDQPTLDARLSHSPAMFIVGAPRSGTGYLDALIGAHRDICMLHELRTVELAGIAGWAATTGGSPARPGLQITGDALAKGMAFVHLLYRDRQLQDGVAHIGEKFPPYALTIPLLAQLHAGARFIHIIRDGRDVLASTQRAHAVLRSWRRGPTPPPPSQTLDNWVGYVRAAQAAGASLPPDRYHELRYEQLMGQPERTAAQLLDWIGVDGDAPFRAHLAQARPRNAGWRRTLGPDELTAVRSHPAATALLDALGYAPTPAPVGPPSTPATWRQRAAQARDAGDDRTEADALRRAISGSTPDVADCAALLRLSARPESLFAAVNCRADARAGPALRDWVVARGLDEDAARALFPDPRV